MGFPGSRVTVGFGSDEELLVETLRSNYCGADEIPDGPVLTLMLRNVPRDMTTEQLVAEVEEVLPKGSYDFIYLPQDMRRGGNVTFAFVNFVDEVSALRAFFLLSGRVWRSGSNVRPCSVVTSRRQGLSRNLAHCLDRAGRLRHRGNPPLLFANGRSIALQDAAAELPKPPPRSRTKAATTPALLPQRKDVQTDSTLATASSRALHWAPACDASALAPMPASVPWPTMWAREPERS